MQVANKFDCELVQIGLNDSGCGHVILMSREHYDACRESNRRWYCTVCGAWRVFVGETTIQQLRRERDAAKQREETLRAQRADLEKKLSLEREILASERKSKDRLKKRLKNGVCPCCTRSFQNLRRHIASKHPEFDKSVGAGDSQK